MIAYIGKTLTRLANQFAYEDEQLRQGVDEVRRNMANGIVDTVRITELNAWATRLQEKINAYNRQITSFRDAVRALQTAVTVLSSLPLPTAPIPVPVGLIMTLAQRLMKLLTKIESILSLLDLHTRQVEQFQIAHRKILSENLYLSPTYGKESEGTVSLTVDQLMRNEIDGYVYKSYTFKIAEQPVTDTISRRKAEAYNELGKVVYSTEFSFTLQPQDLITELRQKIDKNE